MDATGKLDLPGAATVTGALVAAVGALSAIEQIGFAHPLPLALGAVAIVLGIAFVLIERRAAAPLVPLGVLRVRNLAVGNTVMLLVGAAMIALFYALSLYMQSVLGYSALTTGLTQLPLAGALVVIAGVVPALVARRGVRFTLVLALIVLAIGLVWLSFAPADANFAGQILGPTVLIGVGMGGAFVAATQLAVDGVGGGESGLTGGLVNTSQQVGGALGLAVLGTVAGLRTAGLASGGASAAVALTGGFSWLFLGAAAFALAGAAAALLARPSVRG